MRINAIRLIAAVVLAGAQVGCGGMIKDVAREATPEVVSGVVEGLARPETARDVMAIADQGRVQTLTRHVSAGLVDGALDTLEDPSRGRRIEALSDRVLNGALATLETPEHRAQLDALIRRAVGSAVGAGVDSALAHALDEKAQGPMRAAMRATVSELVSVVFESVRSEMGTPEEQGKALGSAAHEVAKNATLGFQDAIDEAKHERANGEIAKGDSSLLLAVGDAGSTGSRIIWTLAIGLSIIALVLALGLIWAIRKNIMRRAELEQRDEALLLLTEAIKSTETEPWSNDLLAAIKKSFGGRKGGEHIRSMLRGAPALQVPTMAHKK